MDHLKFTIDSSEAQTMAKKLGLKSVINLLPIIAKSSRKLAITPISCFSVAAVGLASDGRIFVGVNVEFPGLPLHHSIHAEQFLITNLSLHNPKSKLKNIVVSAYPCGHCRQFLQEIRGAPDIQIFVLDKEDCNDDNGPELGFKPLSDFLPHRFGPNDLLDENEPLIFEQRDNNLAVVNGVVVLSNGDSVVNSNGLISAAFDAANMSHAPYSRCPSGVALVDECGCIFKGSYMESAAYNPSVGPAQAAIIAYMAAKGSDGGGAAAFDKIVGAVLVEFEGGVVTQEETVRLFFNKVSPKCEFRVFHCQRSGSIV